MEDTARANEGAMLPLIPTDDGLEALLFDLRVLSALLFDPRTPRQERAQAA